MSMRIITLLLAVTFIAAQDSRPSFDVASVKISKAAAQEGNVEITPGRFRGKDLALQWLILVAYSLRPDDLSGNLPSWTSAERYDIDATMEGAAGEERILLALQTLLQERFKLRLHRETREQPVYFLTIGKNGSKMRPGNCVPAKKDFPNECWSQGGEGLIRTLDWRGVSISDPTGITYRTLAGQLRLILKRPVIDKTGLTGAFDVHLRWANDPPPTDTTPSPTGSNAPSIFDAMEEQLGLKLESGKGPVEVVVVDSVDKPLPN